VSREKLWDRLFGLRGIYLVSDWLQCIVWAFQLVVVGAPSRAISCSALIVCLRLCLRSIKLFLIFKKFIFLKKVFI
jgi:hypothetical protein